MTTTTDQNNGSTGGLSLREAILAANNNTNNDYVILLQSGLRYFLSINGNDAVGAVGDLDIVGGSNVSIRTTGTPSATINGAGLTQRDQVLGIAPGATVRLENIVVTGGLRGIDNEGDLTIVNGGVTNNGGNISGGGIYNQGTTRLINTTVSGNATNFSGGGGIYNGGSLEIVNSTINNNSSSFANGGGIYNRGSLEIVNSTINNNSSGDLGGGIYLWASGRGNLVNTTISGNSSNSGGGIYSNPFTAVTIFLNNVTVANNRANSDGGGIYNDANLGVYYLTNTLIAGNTIGSSTSNDVVGNFFGDSYNLIGNTTGSTGFGGTDLVNVDARLGPLQNNGGPTFTHALLAGSPAINGGNNLILSEDTFDLDGDGIPNEPLPFDQRGLARISGSAVDIGAFEVQTTSPLPTITLALSLSLIHI